MNYSFYTPIVDDYKSCEQAFYHQYHISTPNWLAEPASALSALAMCIIAICAPPKNSWKTELPAIFWLAQAGLFGNGLGSFFWHGASPNTTVRLSLPSRMLDGLTMAMLTGFTALLFFGRPVKPMIIGAYFTVLWLMWSSYTNDSTTFAFLYHSLGDNAPLLLQFGPVLCIYLLMLYHILISHPWKQCLPFVCILACGLAAWVIDRFACTGILIFSFGHPMWHLFMGYASLLFICYGLERRGYTLVGRWYPELSVNGTEDIDDVSYVPMEKDPSQC